MNKRVNIYTLLLILSLMILQGCTQHREDVIDHSEGTTIDGKKEFANLTEDEEIALRANNIHKGTLIVKLSEDGLRSLNPDKDTPEVLNLRSFQGETQAALRSIGAKKMTRLFPHGGRFEERMRKEGLDRWMILDFDEEQGLPETRALIGDFEDFEYVEFSYVQTLPTTKAVPVSAAELVNTEGTNAKRPFDDPLLKLQWHYYNDGSRLNSKPRADINLFDAWKVESGSPKVKVCVVDGGIDLTHEDLAANVDAENSFNFVRDKNGEYYGKDVFPDEDGHGTHVAGTVAAVNNNGIGVSGVAGGNGTPGTGIKLISAQVYGYSGQVLPPSSIGIVHGANHGAVISQNSWGYRYPGPRELLAHDKEAIDYFIKHAGCDNEGNQLPDSPMKGGVVIFAAGNDYVQYEASPALYSEVVAVSSMAIDFTKSEFTNYGTWVDIMAPGGDQQRFGELGGVLSTLPKNKYGFMQGTSMACPHVSGIAALVVSKYGGQGFTNNDLKKMLTTALRPYDIYALNHPNYQGMLGVGYIDAARALDEMQPNNVAPEAPTSVDVKVDFSFVQMSWNPSVDKDAHGGIAQFYELYISKDEIKDVTSLDPKTAIKVFGENLEKGKVAHSIPDLANDQTYYYALRAVDRWGAISNFVQGEFRTSKNEAPEIISGMSETPWILPSNSKLDFDLKIKDPEGHSWYFEKDGNLKGVVINRTSPETIHVTIYPEQPEGDYTFTIRLIDQYQRTKEYPITFSVIKYEDPQFIFDAKEIVIGLNDKDFKVNLLDKVHVTKGINPTFKVSHSNSELDAQIEAGELILNPKAKGIFPINLVCNDGFASSKITLKVLVVEDSEAIVNIIYPVPVKTNLNVVLNRDIKSATFVVSSLRGEILIREEKNSGMGNKVSLDVHKLTQGTYTLTVMTSKGQYRTSFLKH
ncbi:S8 family serine peptidase [Porphyromonadaceae bacterium W3.11]|nr:S8 family serine peptidase [Porphyromonadaceae bacterium W3.11]